jgi:hypothetical protein
MHGRTAARLRAGVLVIAPAIMLASLVVAHSVRDHFVSVGAAPAALVPDAWTWSHDFPIHGVGLVLGAALMALAAVALHHEFQAVGEDRWSPVGMASLILGSVFMASAAGISTMLDVVARVDGFRPEVEGSSWFVILALAGVFLTALGWIIFAVAFRRASFLGERGRRAAVTLLVGGVIALFVPPLAFLFYVAVLAVCWMVAYNVYSRTLVQRPTAAV